MKLAVSLPLALVLFPQTMLCALVALGAVGSPPHRRYLCLHGGATSGRVMKLQTRALRRALGAGATFDFVDAPHAVPTARVPPELRRLKGTKHAWYDVVDDGDPLRDYCERLGDASIAFEYRGVEESLDMLEAHAAQHEPYDGVIGFSQGAVIATLLTSRRLRAGAPPPWRHLALFCPFPPRDALFAIESPLAISATLVYGRADAFYDYGQLLRRLFVDPTVFETDGGHRFPAAASDSARIAEHLLTL